MGKNIKLRNLFLSVSVSAGILISSATVSFAASDVQALKSDSLINIAAVNSDPTIPALDESNKNNAQVSIKYLNTTEKRVKVSIKKADNTIYFDVKADGKYESFPLQFGEGDYNISLLLNQSGTKYISIKTWNVQVDEINPNSLYLISNPIIDWENAPDAADKAKELTKDLDNDAAKVKGIHDFVTDNIKYDFEKAKSISNDYLPDIDSVLASNGGICYDFAAVYAGMLRSVGIPAKLVMGTSPNIIGYHAWNEVYIDGEWLVIDTTYDSQAKEAGVEFDVYKASADYNVEKEY